MQREHFNSIRSLKKNDNLVITCLSKGKDVVFLKKDYINKILDILNDKSKFKILGTSAQFDGTARKESKYIVKDDFEFNDIIRRSSMPETGQMCSFDV